MNFNNPEFAQFMADEFEKIAKKIVNQELEKQNYIKVWIATVHSVNQDGTVNVVLAGDTTILYNKKNKTKATLVVGDEIYLHSHSTLANAYVGVAKNK